MGGINSPHAVQLEILRTIIEKSCQERVDAIADFGWIIDQAPELIPASDGSLQVQQAGARLNQAIAAHIQAVKQYVDLLTEQSMKFGEA